MKRLIALLAILCALVPVTVYAIGQPDDIVVKAAYCYQSVIQDGDMVCLIHYDIQYTNSPSDYSVDDAFLLRMFTSTAEVASSNLYWPTSFSVTTTTPPAYGYGEGVTSVYFSAADVVTYGVPWLGEGYEFRLQGNPSVFTGTIPSDTLVGATYYDTDGSLRDLGADILTIAQDLEKDWYDNGITLVQSVLDTTVLTDNGATYFLNTIPNLQLMGVEIFESNIQSPAVRDTEYSTSTSSGYESYLAGTVFDTGFDAVSDLFNMPNMLVRSLFTFGIVFIVIFFMLKAQVHPAMCFLGGVGITSISAWIGLVPMALVMDIGFIFALLLAWRIWGPQDA